MNITLWIDGQEQGPYDTEDVLKAVRDGTINSQVLARASSSAKWQPLQKLVPSLQPKTTRATAQKTNWVWIFWVAVALVGVAASAGVTYIISHLPPPTVTVTGQVFIATRGGQNVKLGLVPLLAYPPEKIGPFAKAQTARLMEATNESSDPEEAERLMFSHEWLLKKLPNPTATAKTDADGRFSLKCRRGDVVIAASQREVFNKTERYVWVFKAEGGETMLSNDEMIEIPLLILQKISRLSLGLSK